jgi:hypothetical protein
MKDTLFESVRQKGAETRRTAWGRPAVDLLVVIGLVILALTNHLPAITAIVAAFKGWNFW